MNEPNDSKVIDFFNLCESDLIDDDPCDRRSEDSIFYEAVDKTCDEFGITEEQFYEIYCASAQKGKSNER